MNVCILYYDGFCEFEVVLVAAGFVSQNLITAGIEDKVYISEEGQKFVPDKLISEIDIEDIDLMVVPGGDPAYLYSNSELRNFINEINNRGKLISAICGGTELLAAFGILDGKCCTGDSEGIRLEADYAELFKNANILQEDVVVDGNVVTAEGQAFVEFAYKLWTITNIYGSEREAEKMYKWYKNITG